MKSTILAALVGSAVAVASVPVQAMPAGAIDGASATAPITRVAEGCGAGFARGPAGGCRRIVGERVVVVPRRPVVVVPARPVVVVPARPVVVVRRPVAPCGVRVGPVAVRTGC